MPFNKNEDALKGHHEGDRAAGYKAGKDVMLALDPAVSKSTTASASVIRCAWTRNPLEREHQMISLWKSWIKKVSDREPGTGLRRTIGTAEKLTKALGKKVALGGRRFLRDQRRTMRRIQLGCATRDSHQGEPKSGRSRKRGSHQPRAERTVTPCPFRIAPARPRTSPSRTRGSR